MRSEITVRSRLPSPRFPRVLRSLGPPLEAACAEPVPTSRRAVAPDTVGCAIRMTSPRTTEPPGSSESLDPGVCDHPFGHHWHPANTCYG